jgi:aspartate aminotransferase-like enzyme
MDEETLAWGGEQLPYHRTPEFSASIRECERMLKLACGAEPGARVMMLTASGTAAMEAALINLFAPGERVVVLNSGDFGRRFVEIAEMHDLRVTELRLAPGQPLRPEDLAACDATGCTGFVLNHHETSTGGRHDLSLVAAFCAARGLRLVVDAIGSFLADPLSAAACGIDALIVSTQKGLALPPGMSFVVLSAAAARRAREVPVRSYYFHFARYLDDIVRGQTPFTPAIGILRQLEQRLRRVLATGVDQTIAATAARAAEFSAGLDGLPLRGFAARPSNAVTALEPTDGRAPAEYVRRLAEEHGLVVCPNGGALRDRIFRVGHLGDLSAGDHQRLLRALTALARPRLSITPGILLQK